MTDPLPSQPPTHPTFRQAFFFWFKLGFISFGGPTGQIAIMHNELVVRRRWVGESRFLHALNYCMVLPGPEAQQLAIYIGWLLHRTWGGIVAGALFVLPSAAILWGLGYVYAMHGDVRWVAGIFEGLKPAVLAIVIAAVHRIGGRVLKNGVMWGLAGMAFAAIFFFRIPFPLIILGIGLIGLVGGRVWEEKFLVIRPHASVETESHSILGDLHDSPDHTRPTWKRAARILGVGLVLWVSPILLAATLLGWDHTLVLEGFFFAKAALVTFGGAYAVLPYVAQQAVENYQWITTEQMLDGLGLAETTPGPLIMVVQFVGFLGAFQNPMGLSPLAAATLGAIITTWSTFIPCYLFIFLGAPHIEQLRGNRHLSAALSAITAGVVGVVLNLAVWFGLHILFPEETGGDLFAIGVAVLALLALLRLRWNLIWVIFCGGAAGLARHFVAG